MLKDLKGLTRAFDTSLEGIVIADMKEEGEPLIYCNEAFLKLTGYSKEEVIGYNCRFLQGNDRDQAALVTLRSMLREKKPCKVVLRNYKKNGELFYNNLSLSPLLDGQGKIEYYIGIQHDVTDIFLLHDKVRETKRENEALLGEVHHRVKNNLAVMAGMLDLEITQQDTISALEKSRIRLQSMAMIHEALYDENGLHKIRFDKFIEKFISEIDLIQNKQNLKLQYRLELEKVTLNVNQAIPLSVILAELLNNVYKHAYPDKEYGDVTVRLKMDDEMRVTLDVKDFGVGFSPDELNGNFDTMGFLMVSQLTSQLRGDFEIINCKASNGSVVKIMFKQMAISGSSQAKRILVEVM